MTGESPRCYRNRSIKWYELIPWYQFIPLNTSVTVTSRTLSCHIINFNIWRNNYCNGWPFQTWDWERRVWENYLVPIYLLFRYAEEDPQQDRNVRRIRILSVYVNYMYCKF